ECLPVYMIPSVFTWIPALPLLPSGKLNAKDLPPPSRVRPELGDYVAPRSPAEKALAAIWKEVLELEDVGVQDSFFDLGGSSISAMQVFHRIRDALRSDLPLRVLAESPTIEKLAAQIAAHHDGQLNLARTRLPRVEPDPLAADEPFPLNDIQIAYWMGR